MPPRVFVAFDNGEEEDEDDEDIDDDDDAAAATAAAAAAETAREGEDDGVKEVAEGVEVDRVVPKAVSLFEAIRAARGGKGKAGKMFTGGAAARVGGVGVGVGVVEEFDVDVGVGDLARRVDVFTGEELVEGAVTLLDGVDVVVALAAIAVVLIWCEALLLAAHSNASATAASSSADEFPPREASSASIESLEAGEYCSDFTISGGLTGSGVGCLSGGGSE
jgi:hypothetical protein